MSVYTDCADAARKLLEDWRVRPVTTGIAGIFTELDVIVLAARSASARGAGYTPKQMKLAQREASQAMGALFRTRQAVRYGPVRISDLDGFDGDETPDTYVRLDSKIVFAHPDGPAELVTPNGTWPQMFLQDDENAGKQGRRLGSNRNDFEPWEGQEILAKRAAPSLLSASAEHREILRLRAENSALSERNTELEGELQRLREHAAQHVTKADVEKLLDSRLGQTDRAA